MLQTKIDEFISYLKTENNLTKLATKLNIPFSACMAIASVLEQAGIIQITYPINILEPPKVTFLGYPEIKTQKQISEENKAKNVISTYTFKADQVPVSVEIIDLAQYKLYSISLVELSVGTKIFLDQIKEIMVKEVPP
ncbi:MAG: hypothetical protein QXV64_01455 [Candidatus Anstonellaceae archaeon]